ncbi:MAG: 3-oxoacyl-ACP reductase FabG [Acutalibacteraceae bacterium]|nr:3-oxoacyl-ACP reductase FabG [Acutalibacteraceae bacterium]
MNKTVIITGASGGIGSAATILFAENGWNVVMNYYKSSQSAKLLASSLSAHGYSVFPYYADITDRSSVERMIYDAENKFGKIDALVNNAGIAQQKLFTDITDNDFNEMINVNLKGTFLCCQAVLPGMIHYKSGKIVNISSIWGITGGSCEVHYSASKAAVIGMTKALAKEVAPSSIQVNCIAPGLIETRMNNNIPTDELAQFVDDIPLGRMGEPSEVAQLIYYLCSENSDYITGQVITLDGGITI